MNYVLQNIYSAPTIHFQLQAVKIIPSLVQDQSMVCIPCTFFIITAITSGNQR